MFQRGSWLFFWFPGAYLSICPSPRILFRTLRKTTIFVDFECPANAILSILIMFSLKFLNPQNGFILAWTGDTLHMLCHIILWKSLIYIALFVYILHIWIYTYTYIYVTYSLSQDLVKRSQVHRNICIFTNMYKCIRIYIYLYVTYSLSQDLVKRSPLYSNICIYTHIYIYIRIHISICVTRTLLQDLCEEISHTSQHLYTYTHTFIHTYICIYVTYTLYGVASMSRLLKIISLFCRISSLL